MSKSAKAGLDATVLKDEPMVRDRSLTLALINIRF
jgi:hypothetical protein